MKPLSILVVQRRIIATQVCELPFSIFATYKEFVCRPFLKRLEFSAAIFRSLACVPECPQLGPFPCDVSRKLFSRGTSQELGAELVLTFFEYLRQRAFESIIEGTQEAIDYLESKGERSVPSDVASLSDSLADVAPRQEEENTSNANITAGEKTPSSETEKALPPPRRRGRPRKESRNEG